MQTISTVFWDLDGTLIDSEHLHMQSGDYATQILERELQLKATPLSGDLTGMENRAVLTYYLPMPNLLIIKKCLSAGSNLLLIFY